MAKGEANLAVGKRRNTSSSKRKGKQKIYIERYRYICVCVYTRIRKEEHGISNKNTVLTFVVLY